MSFGFDYNTTTDHTEHDTTDTVDVVDETTENHDADTTENADTDTAGVEAEEEAERENAKEKKARQERARKTAERTLIRRTANKMENLQAATDSELSLIASILGVHANPVDVTVGIMTSERSDFAVLDDVLAIADAPAELRAVEIISLEDKLKDVWNVYAHFDVVPGRAPNDPLTAAKKLVKNIDAFTDEHRQTIDSVNELTKKN